MFAQSCLSENLGSLRHFNIPRQLSLTVQKFCFSHLQLVHPASSMFEFCLLQLGLTWNVPLRIFKKNMSRLMTKPTKWHLRPAKTQISLGTRQVWSKSLLCAPRIDKDLMLLHADSEASDQTGQMPRLIRVFAGCTSFCWFCHEAAHMINLYAYSD